MMKNESIMNNQIKLAVGGIVGFIILVVVLVNFPIVVVGAGERGVVFNSVQGIKKDVLGEGMHFRMPFIETVTKVSVQIHADHLDKIEAGSKDNNQTVYYKVTTNWNIDPDSVEKFYQEQSSSDVQTVATKIVEPIINEAI
jgi:regulator of protease activity HflC (stomatin/prohibitin superfamily)